MFTCIACLLFVVTQYSHHASGLDFSYKATDINGPSNWSKVNIKGNEWEPFVNQKFIDLDISGNECQSKRRPSPVNLVANAKCNDTHEILTRQIRETDCTMSSLNFSITPHSLRADFPLDDSFCERPTVDLPNGYPFRWFAHHIEVHLRAEHVLDGRRYDGEMQMYHLGQADQKRELAVVSVLLDASGFKDDVRLQLYIDEWEAFLNATNEGCKSKRGLRREVKSSSAVSRGVDPLKPYEFYLNQPHVPVLQNEFFLESNEDKFLDLSEPVIPLAEQDNHVRNLQKVKKVPRKRMFPYDIWPTIYFYRYRGMITTPPCSEIVAWRVLDEPLIISKRQLSAMARLLSSYRDPQSCKLKTQTSDTGENMRPLQDINQSRQEVVHCTSKDFTFWKYDASVA
jgi:carbonic anhydrase